MERGIVRMRVGLSYDLLRLSPRLGDLYDKPQNKNARRENVRTHPNKNKHIPIITNTMGLGLEQAGALP